MKSSRVYTKDIVRLFVYLIEWIGSKFYSLISVFFGNSKRERYGFNSPYGLSDNAYYLLIHYLENGLDCIWFTSANDDSNKLHELQLNYKKLKVVKANSFSAALATLKLSFLFITHSHKNVSRIIPDRLIVVNLWHGFPLKKMGYDSAYDNNSLMKWINPYSRNDYIVATSEQCKSFFESCFSIPKDRVLPLGQPRVDHLFELKKLNYSAATRFLYAPTFRHRDPYLLYESFIRAFIQKNCGNLTCRLHPKEAEIARKLSRDFPQVDFSMGGDACLELVGVDVLITDYSSIMLDFMATGKPIVRYIPDEEEFAHDRSGFYIDIDKVCGDIVTLRSIDDVKELDIERRISHLAIPKEVAYQFNTPNACRNIYHFSQRLTKK
ncbi:CDP-glycerol glycerophosphotransferase family protein [Vibrio astriarenae]